MLFGRVIGLCLFFFIILYELYYYIILFGVGTNIFMLWVLLCGINCIEIRYTTSEFVGHDVEKPRYEIDSSYDFFFFSPEISMSR